MPGKRFWLTIITLSSMAAALMACGPAASPSQYSVASLAVEPASIVAGDKTTVTAVVANTGGSEGIYMASLQVNGQRVATQEIGAGPGSTQTVTFPLSESKAGKYDVRVGDKSATLTVTPKLVAEEMELKYDDGQARDCLSLVKPCTGYLVGFTAPAAQFTVDTVKIYAMIYGTPAARNVSRDLQILDKDMKLLYTMPLSGEKFPLRVRVGANLDSTGAWAEFYIPDVPVQGNFFVHIYDGPPTGMGLRIGAEDNVRNTHSDVTVRGDDGVDRPAATWPYSIGNWYGYKNSVNWMVRVSGKALIPQ